jgi:hypothetical protein
MSEFLSAAASSMKVPETLVKRSAEARAKASGASVNDVLQAWAGGESAPAASAPAPQPEAGEDAAAAAEPEPAAEPETAAAPEPTSPTAEEEAPAPAAVVVIDEPESEPVEPEPLRERVRVAARVGMGFGVVAAVFVMVFSAQWLLPRAGLAPADDGSIAFAFSVAPGSLILASALIGLAVGIAGAGFVRAVTGWWRPGMRLVSSHAGSIVAGAVAGLVAGVVVGAVVAGSGTADPLDEAVTLVPLLPAVLWTLFGWVGGGWLIGTLVHALGVPDGLEETEETTGTIVRRRLSAAFSLPVLAALSIAMLVLPAAWVFIQFPQWAPVIAVFISGAVIAFAGMSAARPGMRISAGEFLAAAAGVGVVVLIIMSVLWVQGGGGHGEEDDHSEAHRIVHLV